MYENLLTKADTSFVCVIPTVNFLPTMPEYFHKINDTCHTQVNILLRFYHIDSVIKI